MISEGEFEAETLVAAIGRRSFLRAAAALAAAGVVGASGCGPTRSGPMALTT